MRKYKNYDFCIYAYPSKEGYKSVAVTRAGFYSAFAACKPPMITSKKARAIAVHNLFCDEIPMLALGESFIEHTIKTNKDNKYDINFLFGQIADAGYDIIYYDDDKSGDIAYYCRYTGKGVKR